MISMIFYLSHAYFLTYIIYELNKASDIVSQVFLAQILHVQALSVQAGKLYKAGE